MVVYTGAGCSVTPARGAVIHAVLTAGSPPSRSARAAEGRVGAVRLAGGLVPARVGTARVQLVLLYLHRQGTTSSSHHHLALDCEGRWGTTDDFATSFLHFPLFSTALWDLANSRPVPSLMSSFQLFPCLPCLLPPFAVPCKVVLARPDERET